MPEGLYSQFSCAMPRDPKMSAVGILGRAVYFEASLYCRENLTDGVIDRRTIVHWAVDLSTKRKIAQLEALANEGALERIEHGWRIPDRVWRAWNPTKEQVLQKRSDEAQRKKDYRDAKRRERDGDTPRPEDVPGMSQRDTDAMSQACPEDVPGMSHPCPRQPEPEPEPEPEPKTEPVWVDDSLPQDIDAVIHTLTGRLRA